MDGPGRMVLNERQYSTTAMTTASNQGEADDNSHKDEAVDPVDLSDLENLKLGPDWESARQSTPGPSRSADENRGRSREHKTTVRRDRRPAQSSRNSPRGEGGRARGEKGFSRPREHGERRPATLFKPVVEVSFYPAEEPFKVLTRTMRNSYRTYELFEIARLILEKKERFVVVIRPHPDQEGESPERGNLFISIPDGIPFQSGDEAMSHVFGSCMAHFFDMEETEIDPPKGNFQFVNRCTLTGEWLGPPNYHRYQEFLQEHFSQKISNLSYDDYLKKVETVRDDEAVREWLEKMKRVTRYRTRETNEGSEPLTFYSFEEAKKHLLTNRRNDLVQQVDSVRIEGRQLDRLPPGKIRRSIEAVLEQQRRFPLDTANHLRSRLRKMKFHIYKKGPKGISYVCAAKRKFRDPSMPLAEGAEKLIRFIEENPYIKAGELPSSFLGLEKSPVNEDSSKDESSSKADTDKSSSGEEKKATPLAYPNTPELRRLNQDLRWLVSEGYVTEYGDGRLYASPEIKTSNPRTEKEKK